VPSPDPDNSEHFNSKPRESPQETGSLIAEKKLKETGIQLRKLINKISEENHLPKMRLPDESGDIKEEMKNIESMMTELLSSQERKKHTILNKLAVWVGAIWKGIKPLLKNVLNTASGVSRIGVVADICE
jgi:hypothetical protein